MITATSQFLLPALLPAVSLLVHCCGKPYNKIRPLAAATAAPTGESYTGGATSYGVYMLIKSNIRFVRRHVSRKWRTWDLVS